MSTIVTDNAAWPYRSSAQALMSSGNGDTAGPVNRLELAFPSRSSVPASGVNEDRTYTAWSFPSYDGDLTNIGVNAYANGNAIASHVLIDSSQNNIQTQAQVYHAQGTTTQPKPFEEHRLVRNGVVYVHDGATIIRSDAPAGEPSTNGPKRPSGKRSSSRAQRLDMEQYRTITDIDLRLHELEKEELERFERRQDALKNRQIKDAELKRKREVEDERWKEDDAVHEEEENDLRRKRKRLRRQSAGLPDSISHLELAFLTPDKRALEQFQRSSSPVLNSFISSNKGIRAREVAPKRKYQKSEKYYQRSGPSEGHDKYGRLVWLRAADGKMVTVDCTIMGCRERGKTFNTLLGLLNHISKKHGIKMNGREDVLHRCGKIADMGGGEAQKAAVEMVEPAETGVNGDPVSSPATESWAIPDFRNPMATVETSSEEPQSQDELQLLANAVVNNMVGPEGSQDNGEDLDGVPLHASNVVNNMRESQDARDNTDSRLSQVNDRAWIYQRDVNSWISQDNGESWTAQEGPIANGIVDAAGLQYSHRTLQVEFTSPNIKEEVVPVTENSAYSSLFGSEHSGNMEDVVDGTSIGRKTTPDDIVIERLLAGSGNDEEQELGRIGEYVRTVQEGTPDDVRVERLLGGLSASSWDCL